jgi:hypothetical protein
MVVSMKMATFWDIVLCSLIKIDQCFHHPDDGGSTHL